MSTSAEPASAALSGAAAVRAKSVLSLPVVVATTAIAALVMVTLPEYSASRVHVWPHALVAFFFWFLPLVVVLAGAIRGNTWHLPPFSLRAGLSLLVIGAAVSAISSPFAATSLACLWPTLGGVGWYVVLHHVWSRRGASDETVERRVTTCAAALAIVIAMVSLRAWSNGTWPNWSARNASPFGHSNYTAGAMLLLLPWTVAQASYARGMARGAWALGIAATFVTLLSTGSRGGVLALAVTLVVATVLVTGGRLWSWRRLALLSVAAMMLAGVAVLSNARLRSLVWQRSWSSTARESNTQRSAMFSAGLRLGNDRPLLGWGPGTIALAYPRVRAELDAGTENVLQLHSTPVQLWATSGVVGLAAMVLITSGAVNAIRRARRTPATIAAASSLAGYAAFSLTDHQFDLPVIAGAAAVSLAVLTTSAGRRPAHGPTFAHRVVLIAVLVFAVGPALIRTGYDLRARQLYSHALAALAENRTADYIRALDRATGAAPHDAYYQHRAALALLEQRTSSPDPAIQMRLATDAAERLERSLATGAFTELADFNLGWVYLDLNRPLDAVRHFDAAVRAMPTKGGIFFGLGLAQHALGRHRESVRAFALEAINDPRSLTCPAWELPQLAALLPEIRAEMNRCYDVLAREWPEARLAQAWTNWWFGGAAGPATLRGFNDESNVFVALVPAILRGEPIAADGAWAKLYVAWQRSRDLQRPAPDLFVEVAKGDHAFATALAARAAAQRDDFRGFLVAPTNGNAALVQTLRRQRIGYGVLAGHPEGPPLTDVYIVQENRVVAEFAAALFPTRGAVPGRLLLQLRPETP